MAKGEPYKYGRRFCAFCGKPASKKGEHFWPKWAQGLLPDSDRKVRTRIDKHGVTELSNQYGSLKTTTIRAVCTDCNSIWMSGVEDGTKPILLAMMHGDQRVALTPKRRLQLSRWALMKVMTADRIDDRKDPYFTDEELQGFKEDGLPRMGLVVTLFRYTDDPKLVAHYNRNSMKLLDGKAGPIVQDNVNFTFLFGQIFFQVWAQKGPQPIPIPVGDFTVPIWPLDMGTLYWPPAKAIDPDELMKTQFALDEIAKHMAAIRPDRFRL